MQTVTNPTVTPTRRHHEWWLSLVLIPAGVTVLAAVAIFGIIRAFGF